jgi:CheY-like chemotaxis protein
MSATTKILRCRIVEDVEDDVQLLLRQLRVGGYDVTWATSPNCTRS